MSQPRTWEQEAEELRLLLAEESEESMAYAEGRYWQGYEAGIAWAWIWFILCLTALIVLALVLLFA